MKQKTKGEKQSESEFVLSALIYKQKSCEVCMKKHNEANMILCDRCEDAYHIRCIGLSEIPSGTWICRLCMIDISRLKQEHLMSKRPIEKGSNEQCAGCMQKMNEYFQFEEGETKFQARLISLVTCSSCKQKFHSLCFSQRPTAINCSSCQEAIRQNIPKGHHPFLRYRREERANIAQLNYLELTSSLENEKDLIECGCLPPLQLAAPSKPKDWRIITCYEASLCYALMTRGMIYCQNLVIEMKPDRIEVVIRAHRQSIQKIHKLHRSDEQSYEQFKNKLQEGFIPPLEVKQDRKKGFFMVATDYIPANTIIAQYTGELITARQSLNMINNESIFTLIRNPRSSQSLDIAPSKFANIAIFISGINNSETSNFKLQNVKAIKFRYQGIARLILVTSRPIDPQETLYLNYNGDKAVSQYPTNNFVI